MSDLIAKLEARAKRMDHAGDGLEYYSKMDAALDREVAAALRSMQAQEPEAFRVHDFHVARMPVKAKGKFAEPTEFLYPASREQDAKDTARIMGGTCTPLYAAPVSPAGAVKVKVLIEDALRELDNVTALTDQDANCLGCAENLLNQALSALEPSAQPAQREWRLAGCLPVGHPVRKTRGYPFPGEVRAVFLTRAGLIRYVIEATGEDYAGMLHIFAPDQVEPSAPLPAAPSEGA